MTLGIMSIKSESDWTLIHESEDEDGSNVSNEYRRILIMHMVGHRSFTKQDCRSYIESSGPPRALTI